MKRLMLNNNSEFNAWKSNIDKQYPSGLGHFNPRVPKSYPVLVLYYMYEIGIYAHLLQSSDADLTMFIRLSSTRASLLSRNIRNLL